MGDLPLFGRLILCSCVTLGLTIGEFFVSNYTHSITLLVVANHSFYNLLTLVFGTASIALMKSNAKFLTSKVTYGWNRMEVVGSMISLVFLGSLCFGTTTEALQTISHSGHLDLMHLPEYIFILACVHVLIWFLVLTFIGGYSHYQWRCLDHETKIPTKKYVAPYFNEIHIKNLFRDLASVGLLMVTSVSVYFIDEKQHPRAIKYVDPCIAMVSIGLIIFTSLSLIKKLAVVLLQSLPTSMDSIEKLKEDILQTYQEEILGIHEFHLWSLMHGQIVANLHVTFKNTEAYIKVNTLLNDFLTSRGVTQITVQPEFPRTVAIETEEDGFNSLEKTKESSSHSSCCLITDECSLPCADVYCEPQRCCKPLTSPPVA